MIPGIRIGPLLIPYYGMILMTGVIAAAWLSAYQARRRGLDPNVVWDSLLWVLIGGILGARLWFILNPPPSMIERGITTWYYLTHPLEALATWKGGLGIPGAIVGGVFAFWLYARRRKLNFLEWLDLVAPALALGQAIGRWGNFVNQELYGFPTDLPWKIYIAPEHRLPAYKDFAYYHPLFLYESLFNLANMALLLWLGKRYADHLKPGDLFLIYLVTYPSARFLLDFLRIDAVRIGGVTTIQIFMLIVLVGAAALFALRHRADRVEPVERRPED
ncbi:MAG: prolipoprotein diacylglyceryl transferase [Anaerolineales bacterium]|nr:prolipoprotein diacylglyceryl transferase [Anaerolineales bacterium]MCS7247840.1 prolipoprotein diacylglyceryl transferase [Anaerolineales bacterium]MDW8161650.1 prolipoprotein diacylglyceryl transferase [Anaerolineales bacterium]MDW8447485.1 prolipoprotein diacylglyceryl transferase [Anaerolineales bacterium]